MQRRIAANLLDTTQTREAGDGAEFDANAPVREAGDGAEFDANAPVREAGDGAEFDANASRPREAERPRGDETCHDRNDDHGQDVAEKQMRKIREGAAKRDEQCAEAAGHRPKRRGMQGDVLDDAATSAPNPRGERREREGDGKEEAAAVVVVRSVALDRLRPDPFSKQNKSSQERGRGKRYCDEQLRSGPKGGRLPPQGHRQEAPREEPPGEPKRAHVRGRAIAELDTANSKK